MNCPDCDYAIKEREGMILDSLQKNMSEADAIRKASTERCPRHSVEKKHEAQRDLFEDLIQKTQKLTEGTT